MFVYSRYDEIFGSPKYKTQEEAAAAYVRGESPFVGDTFYVGEVCPVDLSELLPSGADVVEILQQQAQDAVGEAADEWPDATPEMVDELEKALAVVITAWVERHKLEPTFYEVEHSVCYRVISTAEGGVGHEACT